MIKKIEANKQKLIITGLIISDCFCKHVVPILKYNRKLTEDIFSNYFNIVLNWCLNFYNIYTKCPKSLIKKIYDESYDKAEFEEEDYKLIADFLNDLSNNYEREENYNEQYTIDQAFLYLRKANLNVLKKQISNEEDITQQEKFIQDFRHIQKKTDNVEYFDLFDDIDNEIEDAFNEQRQNLFKFPGVLGDYLYYLQRGDLISFTAPAKRGKSWALQEVAILALMNQLRVVFFSFEMSKKQCKKRLYQTLISEVTRLPKGKSQIEIEIPKFEYDEEIEKNIIVKEKKTKKGVSKEKIKRKIKAIKTQVRGGNLRVICPPAYSMTVKQMDQVLDDLVLEGFTPDVIISDYADITAPEKNSEYRHQIDSIWKAYRGLAQKKHCLVVTASHSNNRNSDNDIDEGDVVEDQRKLNHVSIMIAINQTADEKKIDVSRLSVLAHRHEEFNKKEQFVILQKLKIGKFLLDSRRFTDVYYDVSDKKKKRKRK